MNTLTHPNIEDLVAYLENPQAEVFNDISTHLAYCKDCRKQVEKLSALEQVIKQEGENLFRFNDEKNHKLKLAQEQNQIEAFVDQQLQAEEKNNIKNLIEDDPQALKAALHYASHSSAMKRELAEKNNVSPAPVSSSEQVNTWWATIKPWFNPSVWVAVPVTALATAILVINVTAGLFSPGDVMVASYQDNPVIQFYDKGQPPGIGFFTNAFKVVKPFDKMAVSIANTDSLTLRWPAVEKATSYTLRLQMIENGQKVVVAEKNTTATRLTISGIDTRSDHRYEWVLSGKTTEAKTFHTSGGFVTNRQLR